jgi:hypothetical protein
MRDGETGRANEPVKAKEFYVIVKATGERGLLLNELTPGEKEEINKGLELKQWDRYIKAQKETLK